MRTRTAIAATGLLIAATLTACSGSSGSSDKPAVDASSTGPVTGIKTITGSKPTAATAWTAIHAAVPSSKFTLTVTEANDGNHLLGRPHQYTSAMKFSDSRVKASDVEGSEKDDVSRGGGIEVFANHADAQARADYIQAIVKASPIFAEYDYVAGNVVVRVSHYLSPTQAAGYKTAANKLG